MDIAKLCGYRIYPQHFTKIRQLSRRQKITEAEALRRMIEAYGTPTKKV